MAISSTKWRFRCAGTYAGVVSFKNEDEDMTHYMLRVEYYGGKFSVDISERDFNKIQAEKRVGCDVRLDGMLLINGGNPRAVFEHLKFEGEKGFEPIEFQEMIEGMRCEGLGSISRKSTFENDEGKIFCSCKLTCNGGTIRGVTIENDVFNKIPEGTAIVVATVVTEISKSFNAGSVRTEARSQLIIKGARPV